MMEEEKNDIMSKLNSINFEELLEEINKDCVINCINTLGNHSYSLYSYICL